jgi:hypothetical protein
MDGEKFKLISEVADQFGLEVTPEPAEGEDKRFFNIESDGGAINPQKVCEAIYDRLREENKPWDMPELKAAQPHVLTFDDAHIYPIIEGPATP